jgi:hypothetical protein
MSIPRCLLLCWTAAAFGLAAVVAAPPPGTTFARLDLNDGRTLREVTVRSYDPATGRVLLLAGRTAMSLPLALIPAPFDEQVKAAVPVAGSNLTTVPARTPPPAASEGASEGASVAPAPRVVHVTAVAPFGPSDAARVRHREAAMKRAERYFTYEHQAGSSALSVYDRDVEVERTEAIEGWPGRYRTRGRAYIQYYDSRGRSFSRTSSRFEVITEQKPGEDIEVVDFSRLGEFR